VFAILGLRALYFLLADILDYFRYLGIGLALVLLFIGAKMVLDPWWHISVKFSLAVVAGVLLATMLISLLAGPKKQGMPAQP
jgi:tellurite resistance protein TerC